VHNTRIHFIIWAPKSPQNTDDYSFFPLNMDYRTNKIGGSNCYHLNSYLKLYQEMCSQADLKKTSALNEA